MHYFSVFNGVIPGLIDPSYEQCLAADSGEVQKIPSGRRRRWAVQLGMLTFSIGVSTQQWHVAVMGIAYSWITAAAVWQTGINFGPFVRMEYGT
jgi:type IV secretory pathway TrbD component